VTEEAAKEKLGNGSPPGGSSRNKWGTACAHKHTRNPHKLFSALFFYWLRFAKKRN
jgi:hypothetical protein